MRFCALVLALAVAAATPALAGEPVDVALCQTPALDPEIRVHPVRREQRTLVVDSGHRLAGRSEAAVAEALDETFIGYHPDVQRAWAALHTLDAVRGGPPQVQTEDQVASALQMLGVFATTTAVTTLPLADALLVLPRISAVPLSDADPAVLSLIWRVEDEHPLVAALVELSGADPATGVSTNGVAQAPPPRAELDSPRP